MKNFIVVLLLGVTLILAACSSKEEDSLLNAELTDSETENIEKAKADLTTAEFETAIQQSDQFLEGATYEAYLLTRANLSKEHYEKAQEQEIFATDITYEAYKEISEAFVNPEQFEKMMFNIEEENEEKVVKMAYGAYAAKTVQYITPLSPVN